jgi:Zn finger protein HypA/HybF involved in hydrogenase expression
MSKFFICGDCGQMGDPRDLTYEEPADGNYYVEDGSVEKLLRQNKMTYVACPACKSPAVFFKQDSTAPLVTNTAPAQEDDVDFAALLQSQSDDTVDEILLENERASQQPQNRQSPLQQFATGFGGKVVGQPAPNNNGGGNKSDPGVDASRTGIGKHREHVPRVRPVRECHGCGEKFETKYHGTYCKKCLRSKMGNVR